LLPGSSQTQNEGKQGASVDIKEPGSDDGAGDANTTLKPLLEDGGNGQYLRKMIIKWDIKKYILSPWGGF